MLEPARSDDLRFRWLHGTSVDSSLFTVTWRDADGAPALLWITAAGVVGALLMATLGFPPVDMHGPLHRIWGIMDPLCGGTRAVYWMARGRLDVAWRYNPGVLALGTFVAAVYVRAYYGRLRGRWLAVRMRRGPMMVLVAVSLLALEINQQMNAALLMRP